MEAKIFWLDGLEKGQRKGFYGSKEIAPADLLKELSELRPGISLAAIQIPVDLTQNKIVIIVRK